ncbi:MAG: enoyl-CoA hydratase/isomerase family protein, partial [Candidatus Rokubacteria bacterium]|nr:enoyl-CoA hydratase/isomerase family protein [Candidatus Rokubacteria bacterium]
ALLTFNRPEALNAVDAAVLDDLERALARLEAEGEARVVVLTGAGRAFVGGGDIAHMAVLAPDEGERFVHRGQALLRRLERLPKVTVAGLVLEAEAWLVNFCADDRVEGLRAFLEKRRPAYRGRLAPRRQES